MKTLIDWLAHNAEWLNVTATFFAAIIAAIITWILGRRQEKLQKQQVALAEYEINKRLYSTIKNIDELSTTLIIRIYSYFCGTAFVTYRRDLLTEMQDEIIDIRDKFNDCILDFELRLGRSWESVESYRTLITIMNNIVACAKAFESEKAIEREVRCIKSTDDNHIIDTLVEIVIEKYQSGFKELLCNFLKRREQASKINALKKIKERIKPISVK